MSLEFSLRAINPILKEHELRETFDTSRRAGLLWETPKSVPSLVAEKQERTEATEPDDLIFDTDDVDDRVIIGY
jgi:hypothetical protein